MTIPNHHNPRTHLSPEQVRAVAGWLEPRLPGDGDVAVDPLDQSVGQSHQIFVVRRGERRWILRVAPAGAEFTDHGAFDLAHEWKILQAIERSDLPHAHGVLLGDATAPVPNGLLLVEYVVGDVLHGALPERLRTSAGGAGITASIVDALVTVNRFDWQAAGLGTRADEATYLAQQLDKGRALLDDARTRDTPAVDRLLEYLEQNAPSHTELALIHGDFSPMNIIAEPGENPRVTVIDWETATVGGALVDIGYLTARWVHPSENSVLSAFSLGGGDPASHDVIPGWESVARQFAERSGRDLEQLPFYQAFGMARLITSLEARVARAHRRGKTEQAGTFAMMVDACAHHGLARAGAV